MSSAAIERQNLVSLVKLCVRDLLDSALQSDKREVDGDCIHLRNFLNLIENALKHQIKVGNRRSSAMSALLPASADPDRVLWSLLESIPGAEPTTESVRHMPSIHTPLGRCRAWIRMALMQKHLADYIAKLQDCNDLMKQAYHETALMRSDEYALICGLLVGINVVDFNFYLKDEDMDSVDTTVSFEPYLRRDVYSQVNDKDQAKGTDDELQTVLDQKNYVEELNKQLNATVDRLRKENNELRSKCHSIDTAEDLAQQLQDVKSINLKLFEKLQAANAEKDTTKQRLSTVEKERDDAVLRSNELESKLLLAEMEHRQSRDTQDDLEGCKRQIVILESDLKIEREWRKQLQATNHQLAQKSDQLTQEVALLKSHLKQLESYRKKCEELDKTLEEMGAKLCDVQIETEELKEKANNNISTWQDDKEAEFCSACEKPFSVSRRRHHCRKCGQIFCGQCSEGSMPLIRGGKPVRVCDSCQRELLQMYSVNSAAVQPRKTSLTKSNSTSSNNNSNGLGSI